MSGNSAVRATGPVASLLRQLGVSETDPSLAEVVPAAARGNNLVVVTPPAALYAIPGLAGAVSALSQRERGQLLVLVPEAALSEWERVVSMVARASGHAVHAVRTLSRASRLLQSDAVHILVTPPEAALALTQRSALKADRIAGVVLAWPELWTSEEPLTPLLQDIGRDVQRIIFTTEQDRAAGLVERHARRALTVGPLSDELPGPEAGTAPARKSASIRVVNCPWSHRSEALREAIELLDPASSAAWLMLDDPDVARHLPPGTSVTVRAIPREDLVVAYDLPTAAQLAQLAAVADVVLLVPPTAAGWVKRVAPEAKALRLPGAFEAAGDAVGARRRQIADAIEGRSAEGGLLALAPLFERYDPAAIAAILYDLWLERPGAQVTPPPQPSADVLSSATARVWVGVGKKDGATPNDFVAVLTKELKYDRAKIGKIEVRELYSLVEVPAKEAETLAGRLTGVTIRRRRVTARIDQGKKVTSNR